MRACYHTDKWKNNLNQRIPTTKHSCPENDRVTVGLTQLILCKSGKETRRSSFAARSYALST